MKRTLIHNAIIVNEGSQIQGSLVIEDGRIAEILINGKPLSAPCDETIDATGCYLIPGVIDDHVHFREPGLTEKGDMLSESKAAAAGGVTSIMDMPNNKPAITTLDALNAKLDLLNERCIVNHSCYYGATNDNYTDYMKLPDHRVCGIKLFMGSSTGNMLVDDKRSLLRIFTGTDRIIAAHCEQTDLIKKDEQLYRKMYEPREVPMNKHAYIRSVEACAESTRLAIQLAKRAKARLHVLHVSTLRELGYFADTELNEEKRITCEVAVGHLIFSSNDYKKLGARIKVNPSIKNTTHRTALRKALNTNRIDLIATDHAPHLLSDKTGDALTAASGMPSIQYSLINMLQLMEEGFISFEVLVQKMCHAPANLFSIRGRGYIREGYQADLVLVRKQPQPWELTTADILSKCSWSPFEGRCYDWKVEKTFVNGHLVYTDGQVDESYRGEELYFEH